MYPAPAPATAALSRAILLDAALDVLVERGVTIHVIEPTTGYLESDPTILPEASAGDWWDCGEQIHVGVREPWDAPDSVGIAAIGTIRIKISPRAESTQIRVAVTGLHNSATQACTSRGTFEQLLGEEIVTRGKEFAAGKD